MSLFHFVVSFLSLATIRGDSIDLTLAVLAAKCRNLVSVALTCNFRVDTSAKELFNPTPDLKVHDKWSRALPSAEAREF